MISDQRDAHCEACEQLVWDKPWSLHELSPNVWIVFCDDCAETLELDWGK